jgi:uncharacterized membrane protein YfcA
VQLALFAGVMLLASWRMLRGATIQPSSREPRRLAVVAGGTGVGLLSGLVGVGGGCDRPRTGTARRSRD